MATNLDETKREYVRPAASTQIDNMLSYTYSVVRRPNLRRCRMGLFDAVCH